MLLHSAGTDQAELSWTERLPLGYSSAVAFYTDGLEQYSVTGSASRVGVSKKTAQCALVGMFIITSRVLDTPTNI